jgi:hypothetical protein
LVKNYAQVFQTARKVAFDSIPQRIPSPFCTRRSISSITLSLSIYRSALTFFPLQDGKPYILSQSIGPILGTSLSPGYPSGTDGEEFNFVDKSVF